MNKTPSILVDTGFEVDQNGALTEIVIPTVVSTLNTPRKITFEGQTLNWIPSTVAALQELEVYNANIWDTEILKGYTSLQTVRLHDVSTMTLYGLGSYGRYGQFRECTALAAFYAPKLKNIICSSTSSNSGASETFGGCTSLHIVEMPLLQTIVDTNANNNSGALSGVFRGCTGLQNIDFPELVSITSSNTNTNYTYNGVFLNCTNLATFKADKLEEIKGSYATNARGGCFCGCTSLDDVNLPSIKNITSYQFLGCTGLTNVTLGSEGHPVESLGSDVFYNCTQSGLTITVYTSGGVALAGEPWGATNATIVYEEA